MNGPTKSAILDADQTSYHTLIEHVKSVAAHHEATVSRLNTSVQKPGGTYWSGATAEAAEANTHSGWKTTAAAEDIIERYRTTAAPLIDHTIIPELSNARTIIENVESQRDKGITCSEDLQLSYTPVPGTSEKVIEENTKLVQARQAELTKSANDWFSGCQQVAQLVASARKELDGLYDGATGTFDINKALAATAPPATPNSTAKPDGYLAALRSQAAAAADGTTTPAAAPIGDTIDYKQVYPKAVDVGDKNVDPSKLGGVGAVPGVRDVASGREPPAKLAPALQAKDVPAFKDFTRQLLQRQGVPADQIEAQVNKAVENAQNPRLIRTDVPSASPSEHVSRDFGEQWNKFFANASDHGAATGNAMLDEGKKLTGQAGPGAPGVAEAWGALAKDTAKGLYDYASMTPQERLDMLGDEVKRAADNPGGYVGEKLVQGAAGAAAGAVAAPIGAEAAAGARGLLGDLTHTPHPDLPGGHVPDVPEHHTPPTVEHPTPTVEHSPSGPSAPLTVEHPADTFNPHQGQHYTSGDPHYPGGWPPGTPEATWTKGDTDPGWHHINRGERPWMPYQEQISGAERLPDGRIPEYAQLNPDTGKMVNFDGHVIRNGQEVFLDAKDGYAGLATEPGKPWTDGMAKGLLKEVPNQLDALPPGATLEIHVSDPVGASAIRGLLAQNGYGDVSVIYTPKAP